MLNFRNTFAVFFLALGTGNLLRFIFGINIPDWYYWTIGLLTILAATYGSSYIGSNYHFKVICKREKEGEKQVAISFDDGVDPVQTPLILDILKNNRIKATFFCIGKKCEANEALVRRIVYEGHIIGNHTYTHSHWFDFYGSDRMYKELQQTNELLGKFTGKKIRYFRPPYGVTNPTLKKALLKSGHLPVGWSIRSLDTMHKRSASDIFHRVKVRMQAGDIILFHDTVKTIPEVLEALIKFGIENGYTFIGIDELINENAYFE